MLRKRYILGILLLVICLSGCSAKKPELIDLGIPSKESYMKYLTNARNPWEMIVEDGVLYIGGGDYSLNSGPADIWSYKIEQKEWINSGSVYDEAVIRFVRVGDEVIAPGTDPKGSWLFGNYYVLQEDGKWKTIQKVPKAVHMYDIVEVNGGRFYAIGTSADDMSPVQVTYDGDETFTGVPFIKDGGPLFGERVFGYNRVYDFFVIGEELYCLCQAYDKVDSSVAVTGFFKYEDEAFYYVSDFDPREKWSNNRQGRLYDKVVLDDACYFVNGTLYKTKDFASLEILELPDGGSAEDVLLDYNESTGKNDLYILGIKEEGENYKNTIWKYVENETFEEVYSFEYEMGAMSFVKDGKDFFVSIGKMINDVKEATAAYESSIGKIFHIDYK